MSAEQESDAVTGVVTAVRAPIDEAALVRYLQGRLAGVDKGLTLRQFEGGQSNPTYLVETPAGRWVLRKQPGGPLLASAHLIDREARVMSALRGSAVPVPEVALFCDDASIIGTPFFLMSYLHGRIVRDPALPGLSRHARAATYAAAIAALAALHDADWRARGLTGYGRETGYVARQLSRWSQQYAAASSPGSGDEVPAMEWLMAWLPERVPPEGKASIVHGDFRLDNLVLDPHEPRVLAVLDWELSTLGDPLTDVGYFCMPHFLPRGQAGIRGLASVDLEMLGIPTIDQIWERYCQARKLALPAPEVRRFYAAFGFFRMAAIAAGIALRRRQGNATSANAADVASQVALFAEAGQRVAQEL